MITDMNARVAMAQKLSIPQLQQAIKNGTIPAYVGVPLLQDKMRQQQQMQMAAAQQQQGQQGQQQRPIAEEVMEQAGAMGGVDQLPSNLPIQNEEDEENYAGGGIIAFSGNRTSDVRDPDTRTSLDGISPEFGGSTITSEQDTERVANPETASDRAAILNLIKKGWTTSQDIGSAGVRGLGTVADYFNRGLRAVGVPETVAPRVPGEYTFHRSDKGLTPYTDARVASEGGFEANYPVSSQPEAPERTVDNGMFSGVDLTGSDELPPKAPGTPGASSPAQRGTAPTGGVSPATARQISATNPGAPATLKDAERQAASGSPQASAAVSMLDRYVAMLEKSGDDVGRQKKEALYMALIQGGLGMMGGTSPNAFANISAGLLPATQAYQQAIAGIRKDDRARLEKLLSAGLKKEEFLLKAKEIGINQQKADNWYEVMTNRNAAMAARGSGSDDIKTANAIRGLDSQLSTNLARVDAQIRNLNSANPMMAAYVNKSPDQIPKGIRDQVTAYSTQLRKLEGEKNRWINLHSSRVQSLGGVTLGDIEGDSASGVLSMPKSKGELKTGSVYNTARGPAKWDGNQFVSVK
jgi:hypothetical protein